MLLLRFNVQSAKNFKFNRDTNNIVSLFNSNSMDFIKKTVENTIDKSVVATVVWQNNQFFAKVNKVLYYIYNWDSLVGTTEIYSLPTNDYHIPWTKKPVAKPHLHNDPKHNALGILFWGKYKDGMRIHGTIRNNIFYDKRYLKTNITKP